MRILHVTERYSAGGLEDFVDSLSAAMEQYGVESFLATGSLARPSQTIPQDRIDDSLSFSGLNDATIKSFTEDVKALVGLIDRWGIDYLVIHPFRSLCPAVAAAKIAQIPSAFVAHGPLSVSFPYTAVENAYFQFSLRNEVDVLFQVSEGLFPSNDEVADRVYLVRNPIKRANETPSQCVCNKNWALASRLDRDKLGGLLGFLEWMPLLPIERLFVYGSGGCEEEVRAFCISKGISERVEFRGFDSDWLGKADGDVFGIVGLGRVAIEGLASNKPVLLLSQEGRPCGMVSKEIVGLQSSLNFSTRRLKRLDSPECLSAQIERAYEDASAFCHGGYISSLFSPDAIAKGMHERLLHATFRGGSGWSSFLSSLAELDDELLVYQDRAVFNLFFSTFRSTMSSPASYVSAIAASEFTSTYERECSNKAELRNAMSAEFKECAKRLDAVEGDCSSVARKVDGLSRQVGPCQDGSGSLESRVALLEGELASLKRSLLRAEKRNQDLLSSRSWRIGRAVTAIPRWVKRTVHRLVKSFEK